MEGFPFDSQLEYNPETGEPVYDRAVSSQPLRKLIKDLFSTGVMPNPSTCFQVSADGSSMEVTVAAGFAVIDGGLVRETETTTLEVEASDTSLTRIDSVVLKWDENVDVRMPSLYVKKGTASASPVRPSLQRDNSIYEIGLADITVASNVSVITNSSIADTRAETGRCGYVSSVSEWDTTTIYQQIQSDLAEFKSGEEADFETWSDAQETAYETWATNMREEFDDWFETIQDILDENVAAHLQNEIDELSDSVDERLSKVSSIIKINFAEQFEGETYTLTNGTETYTGEVPSTLVIEQSTNLFNTTFVCSVELNNNIYSTNVEIKDYRGLYEANVKYSTVFAFHYSENDSSPNSVTYPAGYDNSDFDDTFYVDLTTGEAHYGDWDKNGIAKWLYPRSCMLKYDGTVDYYLDENDETKKEDGTASDVANSSYAGNAMMEWGQDGSKIYWKIVPDNDNKGFTFVVANEKVDEDIEAWNHYNCNGELAEHFYTAKYFGSSDGTRLRSISGGTNYVSHTASEELTLAKANNQTSSEIWNTGVYADWLLEGMLQVLLCKSMNTQAKFGYGRCKDNNSSAIGQGTMNGRGMFFGKSDQTTGVKIFGIENPYGNLWRRIAGLINDEGSVKVKLTYGTQDGSTATGYNTDGTGYINHGTIGGTSGGYISHAIITNRGITPNTMSGSDSTYYTDGAWFTSAQNKYAMVGGRLNDSLHVGAFCFNLGNGPSNADATYGGSLSCKPLT